MLFPTVESSMSESFLDQVQVRFTPFVSVIMSSVIEGVGRLWVGGGYGWGAGVM